MSRITALFVGIAALTVVSTVAEAADGCGRGWYYNGRRCVPQDEPCYGYRRDLGPPVERGPVLRFDLGGGRREFHGSGWVVQAVHRTKTLGRIAGAEAASVWRLASSRSYFNPGDDR